MICAVVIDVVVPQPNSFFNKGFVFRISYPEDIDEKVKV